ncbi:MAG: M48 family peptidase [Firmicutes bacterium HGW-Firmicutes-7]|nr:MAG: M48 family peptidase [Firmicutes bacterium HGW-Firmicutes-7]
MTHTFLGETIDFNLIYKKRKTIGIYIDIYGHIEVRVPKDTKEERVRQLLEDKWAWVLKKTEEMKLRTAGHKEKVYDHGETFLYLGNVYPIQILSDINIKKDYVLFEQDKLYIYVKQHEVERIKQALKRFYFQQCKLLVEARIRAYQSNFKLKPRAIRISDNKSTWGTCDSKQQLTFNWKLAMAPLEVIDYIVVHEMCHMVHLNHDRSFWRLVGKLLPDYEERQNWLAQSSWKMIV